MIERTIVVRERSTKSLSREEYRLLENHPLFLRLVSDGVLALEQTRSNRYGLRAGPHVGQAVIGNVLLRIEEKVRGSLAALLAVAEQPETRLSDAASFAETQEVILFALVDRFLAALDKYLVQGRAKQYQPREMRGSMPRGKIKMASTMRLWATGRRDLLVYRFHDLSPRVFENQLLGLALHVADAILPATEMRRRRRVRTAAIMFEDTGWQRWLRVPREVIEEKYARIEMRSSQMSSLMAMARLLALHFGVSTAVTDEDVPFSWFVSLETLFQECLLKSMQSAAVDLGLRVTDWRKARRFVLAAERRYHARPDVVVWDPQLPEAVVDAKYKDLESSDEGPKAPGNADLYQLLVHAQAWNVLIGALVYPSDDTAYYELGADALGTKVGYFMLDVRRPVEGARKILETLCPMPLATAPVLEQSNE